jgi:phosphatidylserine decarboxylase
MFLFDLIHRILDWLLAQVRLVQNREIGWRCLDRKTGRYKRERQPILKKVKLWVLFSRPMEWVDQTRLMRKWIHDKSLKAGRKEATNASHNQIKSFVDFYQINMNDFQPSNIEEYDTFESFFVRHHTPESRLIYEKDDATKAVVVADCRLVVYPTVAETKRLWVKGKHFTISNLIQDSERAKAWEDGAVASFRLSPQDYHRYHSPVNGTVEWFKQMSGEYYQVDPLCLRSDVDILTSNARCAVCVNSKEFGRVLFVAIGATDVGTVEINERWQKGGSKINKGDEVGLFQFGGSSIIVAFVKDRIQFDEDLLSVSRQLVMMDVEMGMSLGKATRPEE